VVWHVAIVFVHRLVPSLATLVIQQNVRPQRSDGRDREADSSGAPDAHGDRSLAIPGSTWLALLGLTAWLTWWSGAVAWWIDTGRGHGGRLIAGTTTLGLSRINPTSRTDQ
jgi:hypothetical protein